MACILHLNNLIWKQKVSYCWSNKRKRERGWKEEGRKEGSHMVRSQTIASRVKNNIYNIMHTGEYTLFVMELRSKT